MRPCTGVRIEDMGHKMGCNGVDNGKLWFDGVRVPRAALLDASSQVDRDGSFRRQAGGRLCVLVWACCGGAEGGVGGWGGGGWRRGRGPGGKRSVCWSG
jgi:alkylation response protein AidB-like acyl-CoA dehydrogenase